MSRVIVKNVPTNFEEKIIKDYFSQVGVVTDCKIVRDNQGKSRRFCFIGFIDSQSANKAIKQLNNTFLGVSRITIDKAKTLTQFEQQKKIDSKKQKASSTLQKQQKKKFTQYKKLVQESSKKSWDDMLVPSNQQQVDETLKKKKKQIKRSEKQTDNDREKQISKGKNRNIGKVQLNIKTPELTEKNKNFISKPLGVDGSRLFVKNIPYNLSQQELNKEFSKFGNVTKLKLPKNSSGQNKGYAFVSYALQQQAMRAYSKLDNQVVFGRILHVQPSLEDIGEIIRTKKQEQFEKNKKEKYGQSLDQKTSFKKQKKRQMREKLNDTTSWNTLFLNPNTILERVAKKVGATKAEILLSENLAPKVALAQTQIIAQTKQWMKSAKINLDFFHYDRSRCQRSKTIILVKNLNYKTMVSEIRDLFNYYGVVNEVLLAPNRAIAIVQMASQQYAANAFEKLQHHKFKNNFLYLEYAPVGILQQNDINKQIQKQQEHKQISQQLSKVLYVKNLDYNVDEHILSQFLQKNEVKNVVSVKIITNSQGKPQGYGFIQFSNNKSAESTIKKLQNSILQGRRILLSMSQRKKQNGQKLQKLKQGLQKKVEQASNKLIVKNLAFQATKNQLKDLFKQFGMITKIRVPKKINGQHRGFGFVQFQNSDEAVFAKQSLSSTHLYGRKLVIEFEKGSSN